MSEKIINAHFSRIKNRIETTTLKIIEKTDSYVLKKERVKSLYNGENDNGIEVIYGYSIIDNGFIGDKEDVENLCKKRRIIPQLIEQSDNICSIGFCKHEQKWYGWSHRAIFGFGIGSQIKPGHCAFVPSNKEEYKKEIDEWNSENTEKDSTGEILTKRISYESFFVDPMDEKYGLPSRYNDKEYGVKQWLNEYDELPVACIYHKKVCRRIKDNKILVFTGTDYLPKWGKGTWEAKTLDDAKEMAIEFAKAVS